MLKSFVTTGKGDGGETRSLDGAQLPKDHIMMETLGALDALRGQMALVRVLLLQKRPDDEHDAEFLLFLLHACFIMGSAISDPRDQKMEWRRGHLTPNHLEALEIEQARLEQAMNLPAAFIVCAANEMAAQADIAASTARTFERRMVAFHRAFPEFQQTIYSAFVNRLSDYLFILARSLDNGSYQTVNYDKIIIP